MQNSPGAQTSGNVKPGQQASDKTRILSQRELDTKPVTNVSGSVEANDLHRSVSSSPSTSYCSVNAAAPDAGKLWVGVSDIGGGGDSRQALST